MKLSPHETELTGKWLLKDGQVMADETCSRIKRLTTDFLKKVAKHSNGWETLYRDPVDGRLWELTYPNSELHGGGPPRLDAISSDIAKQKYGIQESG